MARPEDLPALDVGRRTPTPTEAQQMERIIALQNQIRYTFAVQPHILRQHLRNNKWDVIEAADAFWDEEETARNHTGFSNAYYELPMARTVETSRLHARNALRRRLNTDVAGTNPVQHTNTALFGLLQRNRWVLEKAEKDYRSNNANLDDIIDAYSSLRAPRPSAIEQDARLAAFVSLTSTNSIYAARRHLAQNRWDYARAVDAWRRNHGIPEDRAPKLTSSKESVQETEPNDGLRYNNANYPPYPYSFWRERAGIPNDDDERSTSAFLSSDAASDSSLSEEDEAADASDKPVYQDSEHEGFFIEYDRRPAVVNCPDLSKLRVEMIKKGNYKMIIFQGQKEKPRSSTAPRRRFRWHDDEREDDGFYVEFDWKNPDHIQQLNDWRQQLTCPKSAAIFKPRWVPWHPLEEEFLWRQHAEHLEEEVANGRIDPTDGDSYPLRVTGLRKKIWLDALNRKFAGRMEVNGIHMSDEPRPARTVKSIDMTRYRMQSIIEDFGVTIFPHQGSRRKSSNVTKQTRQVRLKSESDSKLDKGNELAESSRTDEGREEDDSNGYEETGAGKRKNADTGEHTATGSKRTRRGKR